MLEVQLQLKYKNILWNQQHKLYDTVVSICEQFWIWDISLLCRLQRIVTSFGVICLIDLQFSPTCTRVQVAKVVKSLVFWDIYFGWYGSFTWKVDLHFVFIAGNREDAKSHWLYFCLQFFCTVCFQMPVLGRTSNYTLRILSAKGEGGTPQIRN